MHYQPLVPVSDRHLVNHHTRKGGGRCWVLLQTREFEGSGLARMVRKENMARSWEEVAPPSQGAPNCGGCDMNMGLLWPVGMDPHSVAEGPADVGKGARGCPWEGCT